MSNGIDDQDLPGPRPTEASLRRRIRETAASVAATEDWVADTLERIARVRPHDAARLRARAASARGFAAQERALAVRYGAGRGEIGPL